MKNKIILGIIVAVLVIGAAIAFANNNTAQDTNTLSTASTAKQDEVLDKKQAMSDPDSGMETSKSAIQEKMEHEKTITSTTDATGSVTTHGTYKDYSPEAVLAAQAAGNKVVLFFHAPWCPFCKTADAAFISRAAELPAGVTILKTDYDSNTELKKKYGVTYQHTFVQLDAQGNILSKWNGGDIDNLKKYIK